MARNKYLQNEETDELDELYRRLSITHSRLDQLERHQNRRQTYGAWIEPEWENGFAQADPPVEPFAYAIASSLHPIFKGHIDVSGASSGDIAFHLLVDPLDTDNDVLVIPYDVYDHFIVVDAGGTAFIGAMVFLESTTGAFSVTWPAS